jgi:hypothetical protein
MQFDAHRLCSRMAHHVGQRLLSHPETGRLTSRIDPLQGWVRKKLDAKIGALRLLVEVPAQRRHRSKSSEIGGRRSKEICLACCRSVSRTAMPLVQLPRDEVALFQVLRGLQIELRCGERLAHLVMRFPRQMPSFVFLDLEETAR